MLYEDRKTALPEAPLKITPALEPWQQHLLEGAWYLQNHNWTTGTYSDKSIDAVCLVGALQKVSAGDRQLMRELGIDAALLKHTHRRAQHRFERFMGSPPECWNDSVARSKDQVIQAMEIVALNKG